MAKETKEEAPKAFSLVEAPKGKGFFLSQQNIFVTGRPFVVTVDAQCNVAEVRNCLSKLGTTNMTDEAFAKAYAKDPAAAIEKAIGKAKDADPEKVSKAKAAAEKAKEKADAAAAAEAKRLKDEEAVRVQAEKDHQAALEAAKD